MAKLKVVFVGSFSKAKGGATGGQLFACLSLLNSPISQEINWIKINSSLKELPPPNAFIRSWYAFFRLLKFIWVITVGGADVALIFGTGGFSLLEKGVMITFAHLIKVPVIFAPRGGSIITKSVIKNKVLKFFLKRCDYVLCQSKRWKKYFYNLGGLKKSRLVVISNWIEVEQYKKISCPSARNAVKILFLGWMIKEKGIYDLLAFVKSNLENAGKMRFILCGGGSELDSFKSKVLELGLSNFFEIKGWVNTEEKFRLLNDADIFVLPSYSEGLPNSLLEAMAAGKAVVTTNVGGIPDVVKHRKNGMLFKAKDVHGLGRCLSELSSDRDLRIRLGKNARNTIVESHNIDSAWKRLFTLINSVADNKSF